MELIFWTIFWWILASLVRYMLTIPDNLQDIPEKKKREKAIIEYHTHYISMIHAIFIISISGYALMKYPWSKGRDWSDIEFIMIRVAAVSPELLLLLHLRYPVWLDLCIQRRVDELAPCHYIRSLLCLLQIVSSFGLTPATIARSR